MYYYIYVLRSIKDGKFYTGFTSNIKARLLKHKSGLVKSTALRRPLKLIYFEGCISRKDAMHRERYLKTAWGKRYINTRIINYLEGHS